MSKKFFKVKNGLHVKPSDPSTITDPEVGDIIVDSQDDNKVKVYQDGEFSTISGSGGTVANFFADFDKLTPTVSNASVSDDAATFLPIDDNKKSKKATFSAAGSVLYEVASEADLEGNQSLIKVWIKTDVQGVTLSSTIDGVKQSTLSVLATGKWKQYEIPFLVAGSNLGFIVESTNAGDVFIDEPFVGLAPAGYIQQVGQAQFVGSLVYSETGCQWSTTSTSLTSLGVNASCIASQIKGNISAPDTNIPGIKIFNPRTDGYYKISNYGQFLTTSNGTGTNNCEYGLSQDGTTSSYTMFSESSGSQWSGVDASNIHDSFRFTDRSDKTIQVVARVKTSQGSAVCRTYGNSSTGLTSKWEVHFFPDASSTIVTQDQGIEVPIQENWENYSPALTSTGSSPSFGNLVTDIAKYKRVGDSINISINRIQNTAGVNGSGTYLFSLPAGLEFADTSEAQTIGHGYLYNGNDRSICSVLQRVGSNNTFQMSCIFDAGENSWGSGYFGIGTNATLEVNVWVDAQINGWASTETKDVKVIGKFEQIGTSDLAIVEARQATSQTLQDNVATAIKYDDKIFDNFNAYNESTGEFTCPKVGKFAAAYNVYFENLDTNSNSTQLLDIRSSGLKNLELARNTHIGGTGAINLSGSTIIDCDSTSRVYTFNGLCNDIDNTTCRTRSGSGSVAYSSLAIHEVPDTTAIVKNLLAESSQTKCQTKFLSASVTSDVADIADLKFSNLEIGKKYRVYYHASLLAQSDSVITTSAKHNGVRLARMFCGNSAGTSQCLSSSVGLFTASTTTLSFETTSFGGTSPRLFEGNGTDTTYATLCQLPDTVVDTEEF